MKAILTLDHQFLKGKDGRIYASNTSINKKLWDRYLEYFEELIVVGRVKNVNVSIKSDYLVENNKVHFYEIPSYKGIKEYFYKRKKILAKIKKISDEDEAFICRIPGRLSSLLLKELIKKNKPFALEVVGDPLDSIKALKINFFIRQFLRLKFYLEMKKYIKLSYAVMFVTESTLQKRYKTNKNARIYSASNVIIHKSDFAKEAKKFKKDINRKQIIITSIGSLNQSYKGVDIALKAIAKLIKRGYNIKFIWVGDGRLKNYYEKLASKLKIENYVKFMGQLTRREVFNILNESDIYIHPSKAEGLPRALIEAMSCGLPCIATDVGGIHELLSAEALVKPGSVKDLYEKINYFIRNKNIMNKEALLNYKMSKKFETSILEKKRSEFYKYIFDYLSTKKILISPFNTDLNRGDQALTWETINIAKDLFPLNKIYLYNSSISNNNLNLQTKKLDIYFINRILKHPLRKCSNNISKFKLIKILICGFTLLYDIIFSLLILFNNKLFNNILFKIIPKNKKEEIDKFKEMNLIIIKGGGFIHSYGNWTDIYKMFFQLYDIFLAKKFNKNVILLPNSIGPLKNFFAKKIVIKALSNCNIFFVRDVKSYNFLTNLKLNPKLSPDLAFYIKPSTKDYTQYLMDKGVDFSKIRIAITLRPYRFDGNINRKILYNNYIFQIKKTISELLARDYHVSLIAHSLGPSAHENDNIPLTEIYNSFINQRNISFINDHKLNCKEIAKIYSYYDLMIGTRFHSVIFALNSLVPAIAIAYGGFKAYGIMQEMGLSEFVVPIENPDSSKIISLVKKILENKNVYIKKIIDYQSKIEDERNKLIEIIKENIL